MMTEKRFTYLDASKTKYIGSFFCNGKPLTNKEVCELLNNGQKLKQEYDRLQRVHGLLHDEHLELEIERDNLKQENKELKEEQQVFFEIVDSFIRGVESEKGIAPENERFQYAMDQTLNWMTRLREDLKNPYQYLKLRKQLEKENKMFLVDKEKENNMF